MIEDKPIPSITLKQLNDLIEESRSTTANGETGIYPFLHGLDMASRTSIINHLISKYEYQNYLEIGVRNNENYDRIIAPLKIGVDPEPLKGCTFEMTSDDYFKQLPADETFDLIFIDGLHLDEQVAKDIANALKHLRSGGTIVMHDCNPPTEHHQRENYEVDGTYPAWNGTTWKAFARLRCTESNLTMAVVNTDWGVGIIRPGEQKLFTTGDQESSEIEFDYQLLEAHRNELLNLISVNDFLRRF